MGYYVAGGLAAVAVCFFVGRLLGRSQRADGVPPMRTAMRAAGVTALAGAFLGVLLVLGAEG